MITDQPSPWRLELLTALRLLARLSEACINAASRAPSSSAAQR
jgi:hypothetical protein